MELKEILQIVFFIVSALVLIGIVTFAWVFIYRKFYYTKHFESCHYSIVRKIVKRYDYRLINNFIFKTGEKKHDRINHIIFGEKYAYLVFSRNFDGDLAGKAEDKSLQFVQRNGERLYTLNQYTYMNTIIDKLCQMTGLQKNFFIGILMTNDDCNNFVDSKFDNLYIVKKSDLSKAIKGIEARDIGKLNEEMLQTAILKLSELNRRKDG